MRRARVWVSPAYSMSRFRCCHENFALNWPKMPIKALKMTKKMSSDEVLTLPEVAAYLKVTERTIYRLAGGKRIPAFKVGGVWRFSRADIDAWIKQQSIEGFDSGSTGDGAAKGQSNDAG